MTCLGWASAQGSGYYVKLVHNCIEFCMNQAIVDVELLRQCTAQRRKIRRLQIPDLTNF